MIEFDDVKQLCAIMVTGSRQANPYMTKGIVINAMQRDMYNVLWVAMIV